MGPSGLEGYLYQKCGNHGERRRRSKILGGSSSDPKPKTLLLKEAACLAVRCSGGFLSVPGIM